MIRARSPTTARRRARLLERSLAVNDGELQCPRRGRTTAAACDGCPFVCRTGPPTSWVTCSYPFPALDTLDRRAHLREDVRIAMAHHLERT